MYLGYFSTNDKKLKTRSIQGKYKIEESRDYESTL